MTTQRLIACPLIAIACLAAPLFAAPYQLQLTESVYYGTFGNGEIVDFIPAANGNAALLGVTTDDSVTVYQMPSAAPQFLATAVFTGAFGGSGPFGEVTSTALDPANRGFGVASVIPGGYEDDGSTPLHNGNVAGKVGVFELATGNVLGYFDVGFHPDSVKFTSDGSSLYVANEGEFTVGGDSDAPGSISVIDLSAVASLADFDFADPGNQKAVDLGDFTFAADNLAPGVSIADLRFNDPSATQRFLHVEPEFMTIDDAGNVHVSLQENSGVAVFDPATLTWTAVHALPNIVNTVDASNRDGAGSDGAIMIDDPVAGAPMPDTIASFTLAGKTFLVSANEGDFRVDDFDRTRVKDLEDDGFPIDPTTKANLNAFYGADFTDDDYLGRLRVSNLDGDTDNDGDIDVLTMPGTRSFSIWDAATGQLVTDSGSLEPFLLAEESNPDFFNMDGDPSEFDARSDDKGPEPEGLDVLLLDNGKVLLAIGMERQNGIILAELSDDGLGGVNISLIDYINSFNDGHYAPESLKFVDPADSPTGAPLLIVGYEGNEDFGYVGSVAVYQVVPEPATMALLGLGGLLIARRPRR